MCIIKILLVCFPLKRVHSDPVNFIMRVPGVVRASEVSITWGFPSIGVYAKFPHCL